MPVAFLNKRDNRRMSVCIIHVTFTNVFVYEQADTGYERFSQHQMNVYRLQQKQNELKELIPIPNKISVPERVSYQSFWTTRRHADSKVFYLKMYVSVCGSNSLQQQGTGRLKLAKYRSTTRWEAM